mmetsp:Transcript_9171/g.17165  ORF Transcript_9171/g.17165 Transcript_9171/m.17165 type:complete len:451 (+) Transcript_9171:450-1802(+)
MYATIVITTSIPLLPTSPFNGGVGGADNLPTITNDMCTNFMLLDLYMTESQHTKHPIHLTPTILGALSYETTQHVLHPDNAHCSVLTSITAKSSGFPQVVITILGDMHFRLIAIDKTVMYPMDPLHPTTDYPFHLKHAVENWASSHDLEVEFMDTNLQHDSTQCGFWVMYLTDVWTRYITSNRSHWPTYLADQMRDEPTGPIFNVPRHRPPASTAVQQCRNNEFIRTYKQTARSQGRLPRTFSHHQSVQESFDPNSLPIERTGPHKDPTIPQWRIARGHPWYPAPPHDIAHPRAFELAAHTSPVTTTIPKPHAAKPLQPPSTTAPSNKTEPAPNSHPYIKFATWNIRNVCGHSYGPPPVPRLALHPVHTVQQSSCAPVAGIVRIHTLDVAAAVGLEQLHEVAFNTLAAVHKGLSSHLQHAHLLPGDLMSLHQPAHYGECHGHCIFILPTA